MRRSSLLNVGITGAVAAVAVGGWLTIGRTDETAVAETVSEATTGIVLASVSATGNVESPAELGVDFQQAGRVVSVSVSPGDSVAAGDELARIEDATQQSALASAQAQLASAEAQLSGALRGSTTAEREQNAASLDQAAVSIRSAEDSLATALEAAATNTAGLQQQVDQALAQLAEADATAAQGAVGYGLSVQQAQDEVAAAVASAGANDAGYELSVDQAEAELDAAAEAEAEAEVTMEEAERSLDSLQAAYDPSAAFGETILDTVNRYRRDQVDCEANGEDPLYTPADGVDCSQVANLLTFAEDVQTEQDGHDLAQEALVTAEGTLASAALAQSSGLLQDRQQIDTAEQSVATARQSQTVGLAQDQQQVASARRTVDTAELSQAEGAQQDAQQIRSGETSLESARSSYAATIAANAVEEQPATDEEVGQARASVASADEQVAAATRDLDDTVLRAPLPGVVASVDGAVGQYAGSGGDSGGDADAGDSSTSTSSTTTGFVVLTDLAILTVSVGFTETDAAKVVAGQDAVIEVEALEQDSIAGRVLTLDVQETVDDNVVTYAALVGFDVVPTGVKPGMTASVEVVLDKRENVVTLPTSALTTQGSSAEVTVRNEDGTDEQRTISLGLRGDSAVEVTDGLDPGDKVVTTSGAGGTPAGGGFTGRPPGGGGIGGGLGG